MQKQFMAAIFACLLGAMLSTLPAGDAKAGLSSVPHVSVTLKQQSLVTPAKVWRAATAARRSIAAAPALT